MSLYIRLYNSFWNNRKTIRLASKDERYLWILPKLWCYAAENQPDGNFSDYSDKEIEMLMQCSSNAPSIRNDLIQAGFMDSDGTLHDWHIHNEYHETFSRKAKSAAKARWLKEKKRKGNDKKGKETSIASSMPQAMLQASTEDINNQFLAKIKENPAYKHVDIDTELQKMDGWLALPKNRRRKKTPQFVLNWLNRIEKPLPTAEQKTLPAGFSQQNGKLVKSFVP